MSTKLHHGYRLVNDVDILDFQTRLREVMNPVRDRIDATWLMAKAVELIDTADINGTPRPVMPLADALNAYDDTQRTESAKGYIQASSSPEFNPYRFEVSFGRDPRTGRILALLFTDHTDFRDAWEALPEVEPYGYWNNVDRPAEVTAAEWDERREAWDLVLPDWKTPVETMLTFSLRNNIYDTGMTRLVTDRAKPDTEKLLREVAPTTRTRCSERRTALLFSAALDSHRASGHEPTTRDMFTIFRRVQRVPATVQNSAAWRALEEAVAAVVDPAAVEWALHGPAAVYADGDDLLADTLLRAASKTPCDPGDKTSGEVADPRLVFAADMGPARAAAEQVLTLLDSTTIYEQA